jgi:hypothetical protein
MTLHLRFRDVLACFIASIGVSVAGAIILGPQTAGAYTIGLGIGFIAAAAVLDYVAPVEVDR